jgi:CBS domain containing-hemolysin-like protein
MSNLSARARWLLLSDFSGVLLAGFLLVANGFFVGAEFALLSARRSQIEPLADAGSRIARTTLMAMENVSLIIAGAQLGITICSLGLGAVGEPAVAHLLEPILAAAQVPMAFLHPIAFGVALTVVVFLHVVLGEMVPKNIALAGPDRVALVLGPPMVAIVTVLRPIIVSLNAVANAVLHLLKIEPKDEIGSTFTREEVAALVEESRGEGLIAKGEYDRLSASLGFTQNTLASVLMPLDSLATISRGATAADIEDICAATGFSRFPVADNEGELLGYLHIKDVLETHEERRQRMIEEKWIRPFASVRSDVVLHEALETLQRRGAHMAKVIDAAGNVLGVATLEDVLEELVGEIRDAHHTEGV